MASFTITFETDPETSGPWQGRKSAKIKMMQGITGYLEERCGCNNVDLRENVPAPVAVAEEPPKIRRRKAI